MVEKYGHTTGCRGCDAVRHNQSGVPHSAQCRERIVKAIKDIYKILELACPGDLNALYQRVMAKGHEWAAFSQDNRMKTGEKKRTDALILPHLMLGQRRTKFADVVEILNVYRNLEKALQAAQR